MAFPEFTPTVPVFIRTLEERHGAKTLIALGDQRISYAEASQRSARLARGLLAQGAGKGTRIAILMPNGPDWVVAWLAVTRIGAIAVPLNTFFQTRELAWILRHADVDPLLTVSGFLTHDYLARLEAAAPGLADAKSGPLHLAALPYLKQSRSPRVLNMSSASALYGVPHLASYSASKFAASVLTHTIRREGWEEGLRATSVCPGMVEPRMTADMEVAEGGFKIDPETIAETIAYALSLPNNSVVAEILVNSRFEPGF